MPRPHITIGKIALRVCNAQLWAPRVQSVVSFITPGPVVNETELDKDNRLE